MFKNEYNNKLDVSNVIETEYHGKVTFWIWRLCNTLIKALKF